MAAASGRLMTKFLAFVGRVAILGSIAAAIFFFGGYYSVAGTATDPEVVKWALSHVRDASAGSASSAITWPSVLEPSAARFFQTVEAERAGRRLNLPSPQHGGPRYSTLGFESPTHGNRGLQFPCPRLRVISFIQTQGNE
jgi:hypothetical protein